MRRDPDARSISARLTDDGGRSSRRYWRALPPLLRAAPGAMPVVEAAYGFWAKRRLGISAALKARSLGNASACRR